MSEEKIEIRTSEDFINALFEINKELREENEQLKRQLEQIPPKIKEVWLK